MRTAISHLPLLHLLTMVLLSVSCTSLSPSQEEILPAEESTVCFRLTTEPETYATGLESLPEEKVVNSVSVLLFDQVGKFITLETLGKPSESDPLLKFFVPTPGNYQLLVVVNHLFTEAEKQRLLGKHLSDIGAMQITDEPEAFVMTSQRINFPIATRRLTDLGVIPVTRLAARIELVLPDEVTPTAIKLTGRKQSSLLQSSSTTQEMKEWSYDATSRRLYCYEESDPASTTLTITASHDGKELKPLTVPLGTLTRNVIHRLTLTRQDFGLAKLTPLNPLSFVALYNIRNDGRWDTDQTIPKIEEYTDDAAYEKMIGELTFSFDQASDSYSSPSKIGGDGSLTYHLPTKEEWMSILPYSRDGENEGPAAMFERNDMDQPSIPFTNLKQSVTVGGETIEATSHFKPIVLTIDGKEKVPACVALRYCGEGSDLERRCYSAWLYYFDYKEGEKDPGDFDKTKQRGLHIASITLMDHPEAGVKSVDDLGQTFWDTYLSKSVRRFMPALAYQMKSSGEGSMSAGKFGHYWSATKTTNSMGSDAVFTLYFYQFFAKVKESTSSTVTRCPVRLFADQPIEATKAIK